MGVDLSTARWLAPASFVYDFAAQLYGILSSPSMKDIHDRNLSFFSPQPLFVAAFFFPQQLSQLAWLYKLWTLKPEKPREKKQLDEFLRYIPYYVLGNVCIGTWMFFWNSENLKAADVFVVINTIAQLFFVATQLGPMDTRNSGSVLTHIVSKTFAGLGVLDILHNTSVAFYKDEMPSTILKVTTGLGFGAVSAMSDWIFGGCLVYDLIALSVGQLQYDASWSKLLGFFAAGSAAIVGVRNYVKPPYVKGDYSRIEEDNVDDTA
ncbi:uncharacterized protein MYCFIDRAFT_70982 [Pseudocercospora fijiensis CIRAD86]|uniref:Uncharacterized protein n=1 Tax=Pseudocercospora fijiensis (strain CIRAD86) TaxID=383855 RepID=M3B8Q5_PSEFD|nr:uncharacterized protein MYCFIDRAFT_70982 [Pseudocercospora fijiensis CIRAD86]EME85688.1 hypothetical protein MYCFIDRAFT_70982 [Pseudocercospora fijiensis CIRAD86]